MAFIGRSSLNLNSLSPLRGGFLVALFFAMGLGFIGTSQALDRSLSSVEVNALETNVKKDPQNLKSRRFLFEHYVKEQNWGKAASLGLPMQSELSQPNQLQLLRALITIEDGPGALGAVEYYHSKFKPSATSHYLAGLGHFYIAKKEAVPAKKMAIVAEAISSFKSAIAVDPTVMESYRAWLRTLKEFSKEYHEEALHVYTLMADASKGKNNYLPEKCEMLLAAHQWSEAELTCKRSMDMNPDNMESYVRFSEALVVRGEKEEAKKVVLKAVARHQDSVVAQRGAADYFYKEQNYIQASEHYNAVVALQPKMADAYLLLAQSEYQQKKYDTALAAFRSNCWLTKTVAKEFVNATGQLRLNFPLHNKYKLVMSSCQELR